MLDRLTAPGRYELLVVRAALLAIALVAIARKVHV